MIKILIGGSPCTHWSIARSTGRETTAEGLGWELFKNYLIAKEKFKPDFFLYENNKSAAEAIKQQIALELGAPLQYINSALVSAQNRQRFYCHNFGVVPPPVDRGILLRDILETGAAVREKGYALTATAHSATAADAITHRARNIAAEPVEDNQLTFAEYEQLTFDSIRIGTIENTAKNPRHDSQQYRVYSPDGKSVTLCGNGGGIGAKTGLYAAPFGETKSGKSLALTATYHKGKPPERVLERHDRTQVAERVAIFNNPHGFNRGGVKYGKSPTMTATGKYQDNNFAIVPTGAAEQVVGRKANADGGYDRNYELRPDQKSNCITQSMRTASICESAETSAADKPVYTVEGGRITIKGKQYPIKLPDGLYIIRKLTVTECCRLQTLPDDYCRAVSATQGYKGLGNGWTAEVIIHLLAHALRGIPKDEEIVVLSMYDGIGTGRYCFDRLGYRNIRYYAYEIDKYAMQIAMSNYPDIIQRGDAFQLRTDDWQLNEKIDRNFGKELSQCG